MTTIFLGWFAVHVVGAIAFVALARKTSVLVDEDERPIQRPAETPEEHVQLVRRIGAAS